MERLVSSGKASPGGGRLPVVSQIETTDELGRFDDESL